MPKGRNTKWHPDTRDSGSRMPFSVGWSLQAELMLLFRGVYLGKHLQEMLADLRRIIVIGSTDEAESVRHQDMVNDISPLRFISI